MPVAFKDRALEKASYQCEYRGPDGARCTQRVGLEIDHRRPFGKRGVHDEENLRALCKRHNLLEAERIYGREFIEEKIRQRQSRSGEETDHGFHHAQADKDLAGARARASTGT